VASTIPNEESKEEKSKTRRQYRIRIMQIEGGARCKERELKILQKADMEIVVRKNIEKMGRMLKVSIETELQCSPIVFSVPIGVIYEGKSWLQSVLKLIANSSRVANLRKWSEKEQKKASRKNSGSACSRKFSRTNSENEIFYDAYEDVQDLLSLDKSYIRTPQEKLLYSEQIPIIEELPSASPEKGKKGNEDVEL